MDDHDICHDLLGAQTLLHRPLGLYPNGARPIEPEHMPASLADPHLAHRARFAFVPQGGQPRSVHFALYGLDGQPPSERHFSGFGDALRMWRAKNDHLGSEALAPNHSAPFYTDDRHYFGKGPDAPLCLRWGIAMARAQPSVERQLIERELMTGLLCLSAEGWMIVPLGIFEGPDTGHEMSSSIMGLDRLALSLCAPSAPTSSVPGPRL